MTLKKDAFKKPFIYLHAVTSVVAFTVLAVLEDPARSVLLPNLPAVYIHFIPPFTIAVISLVDMFVMDSVDDYNKEKQLSEEPGGVN